MGSFPAGRRDDLGTEGGWKLFVEKKWKKNLLEAGLFPLLRATGYIIMIPAAYGPSSLFKNPLLGCARILKALFPKFVIEVKPPSLPVFKPLIYLYFS